MVRTVNEKNTEKKRSSKASRSRGKPSGRKRTDDRRRNPDREEPSERERLYRRRTVRGRRPDPGMEEYYDPGQASDTEQASPAAMSFRMVVFMAAGIVAMTILLIFYIKLQADVTSTSREIANMEKKLSEMKAENDAAYNEINDRISLEEVRDKAINELGMKYADRDQVVIYSGTEEDSVDQISEVEGKK